MNATTEACQQSNIKGDDILRSKAKIFSDPIVLVEKLKIKETKASPSFECQPIQKTKYSSTVEILSRIGNEGLRVTDPHTCCFCERKLHCRENLKIHLETAHCKTKRYCDLCPKVFFTRQTLNKHMIDNHFEKSYICELCDYKGSSKYVFKTHMLCHNLQHPRETSEDEQPMKSVHYKCSKCPMIFAYSKLLKRHQLREHPREAGTQHLQKELPTGNYKCLECKRTYTSTKSLRRHYKRKHPNVNVSQNSKIQLNLHQQKAGCEISSQPQMLSQNEERKSGTKESAAICKLKKKGRHVIKCSRCLELFDTQEKLRRHGLMKHYDGAIFECVCGSVHTSEDFLLLHEMKNGCKLNQMELDEPPPIENIEVVVCDLCLQQFSSYESMDLHWELEHWEANGFVEMIRCFKMTKPPSSLEEFLEEQKMEDFAAAMINDHCYGENSRGDAVKITN